MKYLGISEKNTLSSILKFQEACQKENIKPIFGEDLPIKIGEDIYEWELATEEEVREALINEAKKRGYKEGVKCKFGIIEDIRTIKTNDFEFKLEYNTLCIKRKDGNSDIIFRNGKWNEIIEETEPTKEEINRVLTFLKNQNEQ